MTENKGDLISREALLKRVDEERKYLIARGQTGAEHILVHNFRDLIDNAPTIKLYGGRPIGDWEITSSGVTNYYKCSCCGHPGDIWDNFCRVCGAEMKNHCEM